MPSNAIIQGESSMTLLSNTSDDTLLWAQVKLSATDGVVPSNSFDDLDHRSKNVSEDIMSDAMNIGNRGSSVGEMSASRSHSSTSSMGLRGKGVTEAQVHISII